jgi:hypothetical protein
LTLTHRKPQPKKAPTPTKTKTIMIFNILNNLVEQPNLHAEPLTKHEFWVCRILAKVIVEQLEVAFKSTVIYYHSSVDRSTPILFLGLENLDEVVVDLHCYNNIIFILKKMKYQIFYFVCFDLRVVQQHGVLVCHMWRVRWEPSVDRCVSPCEI